MRKDDNKEDQEIFRQGIYLRGLSAQYLIYPGPLTGMQRFPPEGLLPAVGEAEKVDGGAGYLLI